MRFLSVADRELRTAARHKATYRARWVTGAVFLLFLLWMLWVFVGLSSQQAGLQAFRAFSILAFLYCVFVSTGRTADCISVERREGTLGLLFLTNLNSAEIIAGKLCSSALAAVYGLMALFPMLAVPMLMGGVTFGHFARTVVALLNGIFFALTVGFLASTVCKRQLNAVAMAMGLTLLLGGGFLLGAAAADSYSSSRWLAPWLASFSPLCTLIAADNTRVFGANWYWLSATAVLSVSLGCLALTILILASTWRDRPKRLRPWERLRFRRRSERLPSARRAALRRRLLDINPMFWLAGRQRVSSPVFMVLAVGITVVTVYVAAPYFGRTMGGGLAAPVLGHLFSWLWAGLAIHALVLYYAATTASQRLAEDKQAGALELILSTPLSERTLLRGLWLAYGRKLLFPALLAVLVHGFFIWICMVMATLDPPGFIPPGTTPSRVFWCALFGQPLRGWSLDWTFCFLLRSALLFLALLMLAWLTLGWVGRWLGLRLKHPGFAPMASLALLIVPPVLLFSFACYLADKFHLTRLPSRQILPLMMWLAVVIGGGHCLALSAWAATRLRTQLRAVAMSRYQPLPGWRWRLPSWRATRRVAYGTAAFATAVVLLVASYYGFQNWRSQRAWQSFQAKLQQRGESLQVASVLAVAVADETNFARSPAFLSLLSRTNRATTALLERLHTATPPSGLMDWSHQTNAPLRPFVNKPRPAPKKGPQVKREEDAAAILQDLASPSGELRELAAAAACCPGFQTSTKRDADAVLRPNREPMLLLERLHLLLEVRACALLAVGRNAEAADDVLTGLRLAGLARQLPDARSTPRVQEFLAHSLQPVWEGLRRQAWTEPQLAAIQNQLAGFNLLVDHTNAVHRVVLAHIELWRAIPGNPQLALALPGGDGGYMHEPGWRLQPHNWWLECCIQLHDASRVALEPVDVAAGRIRPANSWPDLGGLPLDAPSQELLQPPTWWAVGPACLAFMQTSLGQATVACALERFRLAQGAYPETLAPLVPTLLERIPPDPVSGRPIIYQCLQSNRFILRGVGTNGKDDRKSASSDDWLWTYSTNAPSAKP